MGKMGKMGKMGETAKSRRLNSGRSNERSWS